ncbi:MAG: 3-dehydroquinate synthase [Eubacterium sp.]|nr:3-dehydroquinate synthase [Eubacterium sp.]
MNHKLPIYYYGEHIYNIEYSDSFNNIINFFRAYNSGGKRKLCIVADSKVAGLYIDELTGLSADYFSKTVQYVFDEGEASKNLDTVKGLYVKLIEEHFDRKDLLLALGGGVTGDMCGYAAATYLRGIDFIQVPTTLLADVDSSIGGKTGVDFDQYKNMVGAFHMPKWVYINLSALNSLDKRQLWSGMGEVVKSALIKDKEFYYWLKDNISLDSPDCFRRIVYTCNMIKKNVVEEDPHETEGEREKLNFGHTLGHALEKHMDFKMLHGECVSIGCILASIISRNKGLLYDGDCDDIVKFIDKNFNLPEPRITDDDIDKIISYTHSDKKAVGDKIKFVLLEGIGNAVISKDVTDDDMRAALKEYFGWIGKNN